MGEMCSRCPWMPLCRRWNLKEIRRDITVFLDFKSNLMGPPGDDRRRRRHPAARHHIAVFHSKAIEQPFASSECEAGSHSWDTQTKRLMVDAAILDLLLPRWWRYERRRLWEFWKISTGKGFLGMGIYFGLWCFFLEWWDLSTGSVVKGGMFGLKPYWHSLEVIEGLWEWIIRC